MRLHGERLILFSCLQVLRRATRRLWRKRNESERHAIVYPGTGGYYPGTAFCWCCFSDNYMFRIEVHGAETYDVTAMPWVMGHAGHCSVERRWWVTKDDPLAFGTVGAYSAVQTLGKGKGNKKIVDRGQDMGETRRDGDVADFVADTSASLSAHETLNKSVIS